MSLSPDAQVKGLRRDRRHNSAFRFSAQRSPGPRSQALLPNCRGSMRRFGISAQDGHRTRTPLRIPLRMPSGVPSVATFIPVGSYFWPTGVLVSEGYPAIAGRGAGSLQGCPSNAVEHQHSWSRSTAGALTSAGSYFWLTPAGLDRGRSVRARGRLHSLALGGRRGQAASMPRCETSVASQGTRRTTRGGPPWIGS